MLILPPGHAQSLHVPRKLSARERRMVGAVLVVVALLAVALSISFVAAGPSSSNGCIYATVPGPVGAEQVHECGAEARATCQSARIPGAFTGGASQTIVAACRRSGVLVRP